MAFSFLLFAVITNASDLSEVVTLRHELGAEFSLTGTVTFATSWSYPVPGHSVTVSDSTGGASADYTPRDGAPALSPGDIVAIHGRTTVTAPDYLFAMVDVYTVLDRTEPPGFRAISIAEVFTGRFDHQPIEITGTVQDAFFDEIDPEVFILVLNDGDDYIYCALKEINLDAAKRRELIGASVSIRGMCRPTYGGVRKHLGRILQNCGIGSLSVLTPAPADVFNVPELGDLALMKPTEIARLGRRRATGRVLALFRGNHALLGNGTSLFSAEFADKALPAIGSVAEVVGFPESDSYRANLLRAEWRAAKKECRDEPEPKPVDSTARALLYDQNGEARVDIFRYGQLLRLTGTVRRSPDRSSRQFILEDNGELFPVDITSLPENEAIPANCEPEARVRVTGICLMIPEGYRGHYSLPKIDGFSIAVRKAADIEVLAGPPWWTTGKLLAAIGLLFASLFLLYLRNRFIRRLSATRIGERTRLAADLHDSITQNLTGAILQLDAARMARHADVGEADRLTSTARKTLESSIAELRRCIWDLRTDAISLRDFEQAVRLTLKPIADAELLHLRFAVDRALFTDAIAHTTLSVIRELVSNAVNHGKASAIRIAGAIDRESNGCPAKLLFSVSDNGTGFNTLTIPGTADGHFGLSGIRERVKSVRGTFEISSYPGTGTNCRVMIPLS